MLRDENFSKLLYVSSSLISRRKIVSSRFVEKRILNTINSKLKKKYMYISVMYMCFMCVRMFEFRASIFRNMRGFVFSVY